MTYGIRSGSCPSLPAQRQNIVVCFLHLFFLIQNSSPSTALRVSETNPSYVETKEILDMENEPKIQDTRRGIDFLIFYLNNIFRKKETNHSEKKRKILRHNFGITPILNLSNLLSRDDYYNYRF